MAIRILLSAILACSLIGGFAWFNYYPASPMITTIGLPGPRADLDRRCGPNYRHIGLVRWVPTRDLVCRGPWQIDSSFREEQDVTLDTFTRRIGHARRFWSVADSSGWQESRDSVVTTMQRAGGRAMSCWKSPASSNPNIRDTQYWQFPSYSVRLVAYRAVDDRNNTPWLLQLDGYRDLPTECVIDPWRYSR
jgi:hypothetical protein